MAKKVVAIGKQSFESVIENDNFLVNRNLENEVLKELDK